MPLALAFATINSNPRHFPLLRQVAISHLLLVIVVYTGGNRGWPGDVPRFRYDISRLQALGWRPRRHSTDAVRHAVERILANGF